MFADELAVSVVLPAYFDDVTTQNISSLRRTLASVHEQVYPSSYEIVLIDHGSAVRIDDLVDMVGRDLFDRTRIIRSARNNGRAHALNLGIREARCPLIARLDCDDRWRPTKIQKQLALFEKDPELTITATGMTPVDPEGKRIVHRTQAGTWQDILRFFAEVGCPFPRGSVVARRETYVRLSGYSHDPQVRHCEDHALWGVWLRFFKPARIEEPLYEYTISETPISERHAAKRAAATRRVSAAFGALDLAETLPGALWELAHALGLRLYEAGCVAHLLWEYGVAIPLSDEAVEPLRSILPDRRISRAADDAPTCDIARVIGREYTSRAGHAYVAVAR